MFNIVYKDEGAVVEIIYKDDFYCSMKKSGHPYKLLIPLWLVFVAKVHPLGQITLNVIIQDRELTRSEDLTFSLVRCPSNYDVIIGRPGINFFPAVPSTSHGMVKFLTEREILTLKSSEEALHIYST